MQFLEQDVLETDITNSKKQLAVIVRTLSVRCTKHDFDYI